MALHRPFLAGLGAVLITLACAAEASKRIALTFDDAPRGDSQHFTGPARADALIDALRSVDAGPVAFFVTTQGLTAQADGHERIARYAKAGHLIANHSHTHPWAHRTAVDAFLADVDRAQHALGHVANYRPWFRFPYLDEGRDQDRIAALAAGLEARDLANGYVTIDNYDWYLDDALQGAVKAGRDVDFDALGRLYVHMLTYAAEYYDAIAEQTLGHSPVHVLLLHENDLAALFVDDVIRALRKGGWTIVSPDVAYETPLPTPNTRFTSQGRVFALAADAGRPRHTMWSWVIDEEMLDIMIARSGAWADD